VTTYRPYSYRAIGSPAPARREDSHDGSFVLGAVRDDIRQTLRTAWIDPALEAGAAYPAIFTAAWSAVRPNVGKSFLGLAKALRADAVEAVRERLEPSDLVPRLQWQLAEEELHRIGDSARSAYLVAPKLQVVVHAFHRMLRRERIPGTGREESPVRRGIPEWQRWMGFQTVSGDSAAMLEDAAEALATPATPGVLRLFGRWPIALAALWVDLAPRAASSEWGPASARLRRIVLAGVNTLPHPMELQWGALKARGVSDDERIALLDLIAAFDSALAAQTLAAAFAWVAFRSPEVGAEG